MAMRLGLLTIARTIRQLWRAPRFTAAAMAVLALGIGATSAIFSLTYAIWLKPLPYASPDRLVSFRDLHQSAGTFGALSGPEFTAYRARARSFTGMAAFSYGARVARIGDDLVRMVADGVSPNLFQVLGVRPILGRDFVPADRGTPRLLLSFATWSERFGRDPAILQKPLVLSGQAYEIIGVMPEGVRFPYGSPAEMWWPMDVESAWRDAAFRELQAVARLRPGASVADANRELEVLSRQLAAGPPASNGGWITEAVPTDFRRNRRSGYPQAFSALLGLVGLFQLIGCTNLAGVLLARQTDRRREIAVCLSLGASPARLIGEALAESLVLSLGGGVIGLGLASVAGTLLARVMPSYLPGLSDVGVNGVVLTFTLVVAVVTALLCGVVPALRMQSVSTMEALAEFRGAGARSRRIQSALVVAELAVAMVLLVGADLMAQSFAALVNRDRGFDAHGLLALNVSLQPAGVPSDGAARVEALTRVIDRVAHVPGVVNAGVTNGFPGSSLGALGGTLLTSASGAKVFAAYHSASAAYLATMRVPIVAGRPFGDIDMRPGARAILINATLARSLWPDGAAVGRTLPLADVPLLSAGPDRFVIVGVTGDLQLDTRASSDIFLPLGAISPYWVDLVVRTDREPDAMREPIRRTIHEFDRNLLLENVSSMEGIISDNAGLQRAQSLLAAVVAALGALLAGVGLYALLSYAVARRMRELGIRIALGARPARLLGWLVGQGALFAGAGIALGAALAIGVTRVLRHEVFGLSRLAPAPFALAAALLLMVALAAILSPARRAIRADPLQAIRNE